jgi:chitin synthase
VAKRGSHWVLKYVPSAVGETDVPDTVPEWISQRRRCVHDGGCLAGAEPHRRWLNGSCGRARSSGERKFIWRHSFFAAIYSLTHVLQIVSTDHSFWRKLALFVESFYNLLQLAFAWFGMGNYYVRDHARLGTSLRLVRRSSSWS